MKFLLPIAARPSFFPIDEHPFPVPLIEVNGKPMIEHVINNLSQLDPDAKFVFVISSADAAQFSLDQTLQLLTKNNCEIVKLKNATQGALCSCLMAINHIKGEELVIANGDQLIESLSPQTLKHFRERKADAGVLTFNSVHPRWSFVKTDDQNQVLQAEEKKVISRNAIAGLYYFSDGDKFIEGAMATIEADRSVNGLFYISPSINEIILNGNNVVAQNIDNEDYHSFYTPGKIHEYEDYVLAKRLERQDTTDTPVNIVIPAAGQGSRFAEAGYEKPKPYIDVLGRAMIEHVIENVAVEKSVTTLLLRSEHVQRESSLSYQFTKDGHNIVEVESLTEGTACTVLLARKHFDNDSPMLVANSDQYVDFDCQAFVDDCIDRDLDGSILVFRDPSKDPKWSFAKLNEDNHVTEVAEKKPISDLATVGIYLFRRGSDFVKAAADMIALNDRVNNEFYTCPVYNYMIKEGLKIGVYEVPMNAMHGLGTPEDLNAYLEHKQA